MSNLLLAPFRHVACPRLDLSLPDTTTLFTPTTIFTIAMLSYYFIISGVMYDVIRSPPPWGARRDEFGNIVYENLVPYSLNQQYVVEGFTSGSVTCAAALALILLSLGPTQLASSLNKYGFKLEPMQVLMLCAGLAGGVMICYMLMLSYLKQKVGGY